MTFVGRWIWIVAATMAAYSCGSGSSRCTPGSTQACVCTNSQMGAQTCNPSGSAYEACQCPIGGDAGNGGDAGDEDSGDSGGGPPSISEYFPSTIGNTWSYTDNYNGTRHSHTRTITERSSDCFTVKDVSTYFNYEDFSKHCIDAQGIVLLSSVTHRSSYTETDILTSPLLQLPVDLSSGQVVSRSSMNKHTSDAATTSVAMIGDATIGDATNDRVTYITYTVTVNGNESVTVPAGTFLGLKVTIVSDMNVRDQQITDVTWWVRNVGAVKLINFSTNDPSSLFSSELTSFTVK